MVSEYAGEVAAAQFTGDESLGRAPDFLVSRHEDHDCQSMLDLAYTHSGQMRGIVSECFIGAAVFNHDHEQEHSPDKSIDRHQLMYQFAKPLHSSNSR